MSLLRFFQWLGVAAGLFLLVGLNYEFESDAGETVNAPVEDSLSQSLLGYWKMDEGTGTSTTADSSGNANNLTMTNADAEDWQAGQIGAFSLDFNGTDEWLTVDDPASGVLDMVDGADFSIVGWFNRDTEDTIDTLVAKRNGDGASDAGYLVWLGTNDILNFEVSDGTDQYSRASTSTYATTGWHHFAAVWDDGTGMNLFIDGVNEGSDTGTLGNIGSLANAVPFRVGAESSTGTENPFDGKLDDVKLYSKALSANEVQKLYQTTVPGNPVDTGLVGHWTFDGNDVNWGDTGLEIKDVSGKGNHGAVSGLTRSSVKIGKLGQGLSFDGTSDYVNAGLASSLNNITQKTLIAWIFPRSAGEGDEGKIMSKYFWELGTCSNNSGFGCAGTSNTLVFLEARTGGAGRGLWRLGANSISVNTWQHVAVAYDNGSTDNDPVFYLNGIQTSATEVNAPVGAINDDSLYKVGIGARETGGGVYTFDGTLDDVRIYNRILSATEISDLYRTGI